MKFFREFVDVNIDNAVERQGMAQSGLAPNAGMSKEQLSRLVTGKGDAGVDSLANLDAVVGLRITMVPDDDLAPDLLAGISIDFTTQVLS